MIVIVDLIRKWFGWWECRDNKDHYNLESQTDISESEWFIYTIGLEKRLVIECVNWRDIELVRIWKLVG